MHIEETYAVRVLFAFEKLNPYIHGGKQLKHVVDKMSCFLTIYYYCCCCKHVSTVNMLESQ